MRLIDADKLHPDRITNGTLAISQSQIANAKTVEAVPLSVKEALEKEADSLSQAYKEEHEKWKSLMLAIEKIHDAIDNAEPDSYLKYADGRKIAISLTKEHIHEIISEVVKECTHDKG